MDIITNTEHKADRTVVHYHLRQPYGVPDITDKFEVLHSRILQLEPAPEIGGAYPEWYEEVNIPALGATIVFCCSEMRSGGGPPEEHIVGPYLKKAPALVVRKEAVTADPQLCAGSRGDRKLIVTGLYATKERLAVDVDWLPPSADDKCQVQLMQDTELAYFNEHASQDRHYHKKGTEIYMVMEGSMTIELDGEDHTLITGDMVIVNPGTVHEVKPEGKSFLCRVVTINCGGPDDKHNVENAK